MKEQDAIADILDDIVLATPLTESSVRTAGGDSDVALPEVIISWDAPRLPAYNGANTLGGYTTDNSGNKDGYEFHLYYQMNVDCLVRHHKEQSRDDFINDIQDQFALYEYNPDNFNSDTAEWEVGSAAPRNNPVAEPDWYQAAVPVTFVLLRRHTVSADTLETINQTDADKLMDTSLEDGEVILETKD